MQIVMDNMESQKNEQTNLQRTQIMLLNETIQHKTKEFDKLQTSYPLMLSQFHQCETMDHKNTLIQNNACPSLKETIQSHKQKIKNITELFDKFNTCIENTKLLCEGELQTNNEFGAKTTDDCEEHEIPKIIIPTDIDEGNATSRRLSVRTLAHAKSESKFLILVGILIVITFAICIIMSFVTTDNPLDFMFIPRSLILVFIESLWQMFLSYLAIRFELKINYTRKLAHLLRIPKFFLSQYLPGFDKNGVNLLMVFAFSQLLYILMFMRTTREKIPLFQYIFISQNRIEDQPNTMMFQVTEDIMRFAVYYPITLWVAWQNKNTAIIFIPQTINSIGDGLAEPIGIKFGKHKYKTFALYFDGKWFNGSFTRSIEGSLCVFITTIVVISIEFGFGIFSNAQYLFLMMTMPLYMTIAEAFAPHTNDGPFLALVGCFILIMGYELINC